LFLERAVRGKKKEDLIQSKRGKKGYSSGSQSFQHEEEKQHRGKKPERKFTPPSNLMKRWWGRLFGGANLT